nr:helix-hairpin-helix domain-containing protein [Brumimicrobium aurantiacum]
MTKIKGIGPVYAKELAAAGFTTYEQIANLSEEDIKKIGELEGLSEDRVESDEWISQAKELAKK